MPRFYRRTAPAVRDGRVRKRNDRRRAPDCCAVPQPPPAVDRRRPGDGYRHLLLKRDVERFVDLVPHWDDVSRGLDVVVLDRGGQGYDGWYDCGVLGICAWPTNMVYELDPDWYAGHRDFLNRIGLRVEDDGSEPCVAHWTPDTARAYQLCHVFLHELGHHVDRMATRSRRDNGPRGEDWAEQCAWAFEVTVLDRYLDEFGLPE